MFKQVFLYFSDSNIIVLGFVLFLMTFLGALIWTFLVQDKAFYQNLSLKPLEDGDKK